MSPTDLICPDCGQPCRAVPIDFGYGVTSYGSDTTDHREIVIVSDCCDYPLEIDPNIALPKQIYCRAGDDPDTEGVF